MKDHTQSKKQIEFLEKELLDLSRNFSIEHPEGTAIDLGWGLFFKLSCFYFMKMEEKQVKDMIDHAVESGLKLAQAVKAKENDPL